MDNLVAEKKALEETLLAANVAKTEAVNSKGVLEGQIKNLEMKLATAKDQVYHYIYIYMYFVYINIHT